MIGVLLQSALAATLLVVDRPDTITDHREAAAALWPAGEVQVRAQPADLVPRFEVHGTTLLWVTERGTAVREVGSASAAILLMRSWSASPELAGGWLDPVEAVPPKTEELAVEPRRRRQREVDDLHLGVVLRVGAPIRRAGATLGWSAGVREGVVRVEVIGGTRNQLLGGSGVDTTFSGMVLVGWSPRWKPAGIRPTVSVGAELQHLRALQSSWFVAHPVAALGLEVRGRSVGLVVRVEVAVSTNPFVRLSVGPRFHF